MEIELNLSNKRVLFIALAGAGLVLLLVGLALLGKPFSPSTVGGSLRLITWQDWQTLKIERQYEQEISVLRSDANALAALLNLRPNPVEAQVLETRIAGHTASGLAALDPARVALDQAALDVLAWSTGTLDRDTAATSLTSAMELLK